MGVLNKDELSDVLNVLFNQMQEQKMLPPQLISDKTQIIEQVAENLSNNCEIDKSDLQKPALQKALCVSLISQGVANKNPDPNAQFDYLELFKDQQNTPKKELSLKLEEALKKLLKLCNKLEPDPNKKLSDDKINDLAAKMANVIANKYEENNDPRLTEQENSLATDTFASLLSPELLALENLFGVDPTKTGGEIIPVLGPVIGDLAGIVDYNGDNATSNAFLDSLNRFDAKADPEGIENSIRVRLDSMGDAIGEALQAEGMYSTAPSLKPPGMNNGH